MQTQESQMLHRRLVDQQAKETTFLQDRHRLEAERDSLQFQLASLSTQLNSQKSAAVL